MDSVDLSLSQYRLSVSSIVEHVHYVNKFDHDAKFCYTSNEKSRKYSISSPFLSLKDWDIVSLSFWECSSMVNIHFTRYF